MTEIDFDGWKKVDLRIATVVSAEKVPKADRLLRLIVRTGNEERQIVAGIGETHDPEQLTGRQIVLVANLKPAVIRGVESRGMLLAAVQGDSTVLITPESEIADGSRVS